ncbi:MAG: competence/damage-inducible protein A [Actinomycetota bacterium]|nr:competence/damage-inducible protein A [Actinomycetota bacterium]
MGTELLLGQIANTNAQYVSSALADIGVNVFWHSVVGDNLDRMTSVIEQARDRNDVVIITGGLGPTPDDITREAVAAVAQAPLERDERLADAIRDVFHRLHRAMPEANLKQADLPRGATPIEPEGTAPGFIVEADGKVLIALPGVPWEMKAMLGKTVVPLLSERAGGGALVSSEIYVVGLGESATHEKIADLVEAQTNPSIAFLAGRGQVRVRLTARASTREEAEALIAPVEVDVRARLGDWAVRGSVGSLAEALGAILVERGETVAAAESLTGGLIAAELTRAKGASLYFAGSLVTYATESKHRVAGVPESLLEGPGPVSEEVARALAEGAARSFDAHLGISATGVAGPTEQGGQPVGAIFVGACYRGRVEARRIRGYGDRSHTKAIAVTYAIDLGRRLLLHP